MAVVKRMMLGETKVEICDDYCKNTTQEEIDAIIENVKQIFLQHCEARAMRDLREKGKTENAK